MSTKGHKQTFQLNFYHAGPTQADTFEVILK
jgi:hypothetical protein